MFTRLTARIRSAFAGFRTLLAKTAFFAAGRVTRLAYLLLPKAQ